MSHRERVVRVTFFYEWAFLSLDEDVSRRHKIRSVGSAAYGHKIFFTFPHATYIIQHHHVAAFRTIVCLRSVSSILPQ